MTVRWLGHKSLKIMIALAIGLSQFATDSEVARAGQRPASVTESDKTFSESVSSLPRARRTAIERLLEALYFIDYDHAAPELLELFMGRMKVEEVTFPHLYDENGLEAFEAYLKGRKKLKSAHGPLTVEVLQAVHRIAAPFYFTDDNDKLIRPGSLRALTEYGLEFDSGLDPEQIKTIEENPYLRFVPATGMTEDGRLVKHKRVRNGQRTRGVIIYPRPHDIKLEALERIRSIHPDLVARVLDFQRLHGEADGDIDRALTRDLIQALLEERLSAFEAKASLLGDVLSGASAAKYIELIANLQRDLISIHPFLDGNGRVSRLVPYHLAERKGLPIPRLLQPNDDLFLSSESWTEQVREGIDATRRLRADLARRLNAGLSIETSLELLIPVGMSTSNDQELRNAFNSDRRLKNAFVRDPVATVRRLKSDLRTTPNSCSGIFESVQVSRLNSRRAG